MATAAAPPQLGQVPPGPASPVPGQQSSLTAVVTPPKTPVSEEPNPQSAAKPDEEMQALLDRWGKRLIDVVTEKRSQWEWKRRPKILTILKNKEMLKGNHNIGVLPGTYQTFDAFEEYWNYMGASDDRNADRTMDKRPHNFYQMLEKAFVAALSAQIPKSRWLPANPNIEEDRATASVASRVETIIERANDPDIMLMTELMELFTSGCYFKFTRYVVNKDRTGTHKQTVLQLLKTDILPARYTCFNCGVTTPEDALAGQTTFACPNCGTPFGPQNFFEPHTETVPVAEQRADVPNGMVLQTVYGPMHVNVDPDAPDLLNTCLLNVAEEVSLGWLRRTFSEKWDELQAGESGGSSATTLERQWREMLTAAPQGSAYFAFSNQSKPTYNRTWIQPMLFAEAEGITKGECEELTQAFPDGCMLAWVNELPLQIRPAKLTDEWTWDGTEVAGFGLMPEPAGNPAVPVQERLNDCISKIDEYMDRLACGLLLINAEYLDAQAMNNKPILPGILNEIHLRKGAPLSNIQELIFQVRAEIDAMIFQYAASLKSDMELLVGTPPQVFGAGTQEGIETASGQAQQLNTGMVKLGLHWLTIRKEHARAAENAVKCAAKNMTEDWQLTVADEAKEFYAEYVHLDQMKGSVHAEPETDQGFPMTYADIKAWYQQLFTGANTEMAQWLMSEPDNMDNALRYIGVPGLVAPGASMREKMLQVINILVKSPATEQPDPMKAGETVMIPAVQPNKYLDDLAASQKILESWTQLHWDKVKDNQQALDSLVAYYKLCVVFEKELEAERQLSGAAPPQGTPQPVGATA